MILSLVACVPPEFSETEWTELRRMHVRELAPPADPVDPIAELGRSLYVDAGLSHVEGGVAVSCQTCHQLCVGPDGQLCDDLLEGGVTGSDVRDDNALSHGAGGSTERNTPTVLYSAHRDRWGWGARFCTLEEQILFPLASAGAYNVTDPTAAVAFRVWTTHRAAYDAAFPGELAPDQIEANAALAVGELLRSLDAPPSRFDQFVDGDPALDPDELRGLKVFLRQGGCVDCHNGPLLSDGEAYEVLRQTTDLGRAKTEDACGGVDDSDAYAFQTPSLRAIGRTAPYMHDGRFETLADVVSQAYSWPDSPGADVRALELSAADEAALVVFLGTLEPEP